MPLVLKTDTSPLLADGAIYRALGTQQTRSCERRYVIAVPGEIRAYRAAEMHGIGFLFDLYPNAEHWRRLYPVKRGKSILSKDACAEIMRECQTAGDYDSPPQLRAVPYVNRKYLVKNPLD